MRPLKKRCRILPAGGLGVSPNLKKSPKIGGYRGLIETIQAISVNTISQCAIIPALEMHSDL